MQLQKTDAARTALLQRGPELNLQDRRLLILSDGRRSVDDIVALLGADARPALLRLLDRGYLIGAARSAALPATSIAVPAPSSSATAPPPPRRSLAATKMYLLDILQLRRDPDAAALCAAINTSKGQEALITAILDATAHIQRTSNASFGRRVIDRVSETIPEEALYALALRCAGMSG
jgi:hypothetical protein